MAGTKDARRFLTRQAAKAAGLDRYFSGKECPQGHVGERYVISYGCIQCAEEACHVRQKAARESTPPSARRIAAESRAAAIAANLVRYFTGIPCKRGHVADRFVKDNGCVECDKARKVGNESVRKRTRAYYDRNREKIAQQGKEHRAQNAEKISKQRKSYRDSNKEWINAKIREWAKANPEKRRAGERAREGRERGAEGTHTYADIQAIGKAQRWRCAAPGCDAHIRRGYHVDHIMPIALEGSNARTNLQLMCQPCNQSKGVKHPIEWAQSLGRLI